MIQFLFLIFLFDLLGSSALLQCPALDPLISEQSKIIAIFFFSLSFPLLGCLIWNLLWGLLDWFFLLDCLLFRLSKCLLRLHLNLLLLGLHLEFLELAWNHIDKQCAFGARLTKIKLAIFTMVTGVLLRYPWMWKTWLISKFGTFPEVCAAVPFIVMNARLQSTFLADSTYHVLMRVYFVA